MAATEAQVRVFRRMIAEPTAVTYTDDDLVEIIEKHKLTDVAGYDPLLDDGTDNEEWTPTYDLHAAASEIWAEKAATESGRMDFKVEGGDFSASQVYEHAMVMSRYHASRRAVKALRVEPQPKV